MAALRCRLSTNGNVLSVHTSKSEPTKIWWRWPSCAT